ncbi:hypothetical protein DL770_005132 [Monosporascus sp. CRB-9-2]|nr:hypothetical protein DL770_005132 [Monosporascus sp. CRB-9-2]
MRCQPARTWNRTLCDVGPDVVDRVPAVARPTWTVRTQGYTRFVYPVLNSGFSFRARSTTVPDRRLLDDEPNSLGLRVTSYKIGSVIVKGYPLLMTGPAGGEPTVVDGNDWVHKYVDHLKAHIAYFPEANSGGFVSLCPWLAKEGDIIALFHGATVPYLIRVIRKVDSSEEVPALTEAHAPTEAHEEYELVEECFVEGIVARELMEEKL